MNGAIQDSLLAEIRDSLGAGSVLTEVGDCARYETGWRYGRGRAAAVVRPRSTAEVAAVLALAQRKGVRIIAAGANTGLVGASVPDASGDMLVLSLERLDKVVEVDPLDAVAVVEGGVTLSRLNEALEAHGLWFPIDLGADPQIGGMVATNTGGTRLLRYGDVRRNLLGVEVVLADGTVLDLGHRLRKNNVGFDTKQLFVGTSGSFGIVTRAVLALAPRPQQRASALVAVTSGEAVLELLRALQREAGEMLSAFEAIGRDALEVTLEHGANLRAPFRSAPPPVYAVLVELSSTMGPARVDLESVLEGCLVEHAESAAGGGVEDVSIGRSEDFWAIRHQVSECLREAGSVLAFDLAVPRSKLAAFTAAVRAKVLARFPYVSICDFGHWGDGGTHLNLVWDPANEDVDAAILWAALRELVYDTCVGEFDGSFSAEHGVGPHNLEFYRRHVPDAVRRIAGELQARFDPDRRLGVVDWR